MGFSSFFLLKNSDFDALRFQPGDRGVWQSHLHPGLYPRAIEDEWLAGFDLLMTH